MSLCVLGFGKWFWVCIHVSTVRLQEVLWTHDMISQSLVNISRMDFILRKLYHVCFVPLPTFKHNPTQVLIESDLDETTSVHHLKSHFFHLRGIPTDCLEICCDEGGGFHRAMWMEGCTTLNVWYWPRELLQLGPCYVKFEGSGSGNIYIYIYL